MQIQNVHTNYCISFSFGTDHLFHLFSLSYNCLSTRLHPLICLIIFGSAQMWTLLQILSILFVFDLIITPYTSFLDHHSLLFSSSPNTISRQSTKFENSWMCFWFRPHKEWRKNRGGWWELGKTLINSWYQQYGSWYQNSYADTCLWLLFDWLFILFSYSCSKSFLLTMLNL